MLSDEDILSLWQDPTFFGAFTGINTFINAIFALKKEDISGERIRSLIRFLFRFQRDNS